MKKLLLFLLLAGCSELPTMKYCHEVAYQRSGADIVMQAKCTAPIGG